MYLFPATIIFHAGMREQWSIYIPRVGRRSRADGNEGSIPRRARGGPPTHE
jgi:hypothetical protein